MRSEPAIKYGPKDNNLQLIFLMDYIWKPGILFSGPISNIDLGNGLVPIRQQAWPKRKWPKMPVILVCLSLTMHMTKTKKKCLKFIHISGMYRLRALALSVMDGNIFSVHNRMKTGLHTMKFWWHHLGMLFWHVPILIVGKFLAEM